MNFLPIRFQMPLPIHNIFQVDEIVPVLDLHLPGGEVHRFHVNVLVNVFDFVKPRMRLAVGGDEPVAAEVAIAGRASRTEVAAVSPEGLLSSLRRDVTRRRQRLLRSAQALIHPVPDRAALQIGSAVNQIPIRPEIAAAVAHRVLVFTHDERFGFRPG